MLCKQQQALLAGKDVIEKGERRPAVIEKIMADLIATEPLVKLDYAAICNPDTLKEVGDTLGEILPDSLLVAALYVGPTRLVDNILWRSDGYWLT